MIKAKDLGNFFKIPLDTRDLNYKSYYAKGVRIKRSNEEYSSNQNNISNVQLNKILKKLIQ